jgi:predicted NAD-dependent protein-ADP-ribosyltransferase YbiA (DUF1768 family)
MRTFKIKINKNQCVTTILLASGDAALIKTAPHDMIVGRLNEVAAARKPIVKWTT